MNILTTSSAVSLLPLQELLRMNDVKGDAWAVVMGAFFDCAAHCYKKGATPSKWGYLPGWVGNHLDADSEYFDLFSAASYEELIAYGNYLHRVTLALEHAGLSY